MSRKVEKNLQSEESRTFWDHVDGIAAEVETWPWWKKGDPAPPEELPKCNECDGELGRCSCGMIE